MSLHLSKSHIIGNHMPWLIIILINLSIRRVKQIKRLVSILSQVLLCKQENDIEESKNGTRQRLNISHKLNILINFSLSVKTVTLIFISGRCSASSSAKQENSGSIYNLVKN